MPAAEDRAIRIRPAEGPQDIAHVRALFQAYAAALNVDLCFQDFESELAALPGAYAPPRGLLLLAVAQTGPVGCVAMRPLAAAGEAEMKRLYVSPAVRGRGVGRRLVETLISDVRALGYRALRLDTLPEMAAAQALYRELGFVETAAYVHNPVPGAKFFRLTLL